MNLLKKYVFLIFICSVLFSIKVTNAQSQDSVYFISYDEISKIIDGDTFKFKKNDKSNRLLCLDTEETYKGKNASDKTSEIADSWLDYYYQVKIEKGSNRPIKLESPFGYETAEWTAEFFKDVKQVRIEVDDVLRITDIYGRDLVYVFAEKDGKFVNYNLECIKQGYSPYFNKYGNSKRFHFEFIEAQEYARRNKLGIWNPDSKCYPDYDDRVKWWNERAFQIDNFNAKSLFNKDYINLSNNDAVYRLNDNIGKEITVFGNASHFYSERYPYLIRIMISKEVNFDIYIEESESGLLYELDTDKMESYYFYCIGKIEKNGNKFRMKLTDINQIYFE
jgi:endonuclease YncB( thermonuclease family)